MNPRLFRNCLLVTTLIACGFDCRAQEVAENSLATSTSNRVTRLPEVTVTEWLGHEEQPIGPYQQPEWTARRRFATTRVYVQPPWQVETETSWEATYPRHGSPSHELTQEIELGLPHRFQVDYEYHETVNNGQWRYNASSFELRWAVADWGKLPLNPTLKVEYHLNNGFADDAVFVLQLGDQLAPRWHWGADLFYGQQFGDDRKTEHAATFAISYTLIDEKLGVGLEMRLSDETDNLDRHSHLQYALGPSLQWRLTPRTHLDIVPLFGATGPSPLVETFIFFGIEFGPGSERAEALSPASLRNK